MRKRKMFEIFAERAGYSKDFVEIGLPSQMEKFADLIIQECINACGSDFGTKLIKQHFDIKG